MATPNHEPEMDIDIETSPSELARVRRLSKVTGVPPSCLLNSKPKHNTPNSSPQTLPDGDQNQDKVLEEAPILPLPNANSTFPDDDLESLAPSEKLRREEDDLMCAFGGEYHEPHPFDRMELEAAYRSPLLDDIEELMLQGDKEVRKLTQERMRFLDSEPEVPYFDERIMRGDLDVEWVVRKGERKEGKYELRDTVRFRGIVREEIVETLENLTVDVQLAPPSFNGPAGRERAPTLTVRRGYVENERKVLGEWGTLRERIAAREKVVGGESAVGDEDSGVYLGMSEKEIHDQYHALFASGRTDYDTSYAKNLLEIHRGPDCLYCKSSKPPFGAFDREIELRERERRKRRREKEPEREMERAMADPKGGRDVVAGLRGLVREEVGELVRIVR